MADEKRKRIDWLYAMPALAMSFVLASQALTIAETGRPHSWIFLIGASTLFVVAAVLALISPRRRRSEARPDPR